MMWPERGFRPALQVGAVVAALAPLLACAAGDDAALDEGADQRPGTQTGLGAETPAVETPTADRRLPAADTGRPAADPQFEYALQDALAAAARGRLEVAAELARAAELRATEVNDLDAALQAAVLPGLWWLWATGEAETSIAMVDSALSRYPIDRLTPPRAVDLTLAAFFADAAQAPRARAFLSRYVRDVRPGVAGEELELPSSYHSARGAISLVEGRFAEAIHALESAAAGRLRGPLAPDFRLGLAWERAGARDSAVRAYERFVERAAPGLAGPGPIEADVWAVPYALTSLGELYEESGDEAGAAGYFERFVELWEAADPPLQVEVTEVRERLRGLRR